MMRELQGTPLVLSHVTQPTGLHLSVNMSSLFLHSRHLTGHYSETKESSWSH